MKDATYRVDHVITVKDGQKQFCYEVFDGGRRVGAMRFEPLVIAWDDPWKVNPECGKDLLAFFNSAPKRYGDREKVAVGLGFIMVHDAFGDAQAFRFGDVIGKLIDCEGIKRTYTAEFLFAEMMEAHVCRGQRKIV